MTPASIMPDVTTIKQLRQLIASIISNEKAYNVPGVCSRYGLADGTNDEAFASKFKYVMKRIQPLPPAEILRVARVLQSDEANAELGEVLIKLEEKSGPLITSLTRQRIMEELHVVPLSGKLQEIEFIKKLWPAWHLYLLAEAVFSISGGDI